jgi:predicted RNase H-like HicB family nuclease
MAYSVTLEHGSDGSCLAWVHELPGCFVRGTSRDDVAAKLPRAIDDFLAWLRGSGEPVDESRSHDFVVVEEVESIVETSEDTEALVLADRKRLTGDEWARIERWLAHSRRDVLEALDRIPQDQLESRAEGSSRTLREELMHIAFVELMYAAWTFDLRTTAGLREYLEWTRSIAAARMRDMSEHDDGSVTYAEWAGAPGPEEWTARKAARRLVWHELLHLPSLRDR